MLLLLIIVYLFQVLLCYVVGLLYYAILKAKARGAETPPPSPLGSVWGFLLCVCNAIIYVLIWRVPYV